MPSFNVQNAKSLEITEGKVKTIHDSNDQLLWGAVGYSTKYEGDTYQFTTTGKNKIDYLTAVPATAQTTTTFVTNGFRSVTTSSGYATKITLSIKASTTYALSWSLSIEAQCSPLVRVYKGTTTSSGFYVSQDATSGSGSLSFTTDSGATDINIWFYNGSPAEGTTVWTYIQLEENTSATSYEPYTAGASPNPSYPQQIDTVTGEQTVVVAGKNLLPPPADFNDTLGTLNISCSKGVWTFSGTSQSGYTQSSKSVIAPYTIQAGDYFHYNNTLVSTRINIALTFTDNTTFAVAMNVANRIVSLEDYVGKTISTVKANFNAGYEFNGTAKPMILHNVSTATAYEPYQGQSYKVNLGKNIWGGFTTYQRDTSGVIFDTNSDGTITASGEATANVFSLTGQLASSNGTYVTLKPGTYYLSAADTLPSGVRMQIISVPDSVALRDGAGPITVETAAKVAIRIVAESGTDFGDGVTFRPMLEVGSTATTYAPYFTPIELCKIGTYQDYIWKDGADWKVHKELGKTTFVGDNSEGWWLQTGTTNEMRAPFSGSFSGAPIISNYFHNSASTSETGAMRLYSNDYIRAISNQTSASDFKTWLGTHNTTVYYALATPTDTTITDATLIAQLDAIEAWLTRYGYSATVSGTLPLVINQTGLS